MPSPNWMLIMLLAASFTTSTAPLRKGRSDGPPITAHAPFNFGISVHDAEATARWYEANLGLKRKKADAYAHGRVIILGSGDAEVEIIEDDRAHDVGKGLVDYQKHGIFKIGFYVTGLDDMVTRLKERKIHFYHDTFVDDELKLRSAIISDNEGNTIQLFEPVHTKTSKKSP